MSKILIIEDDDTMRIGIEHVLKNAGHDVISVRGGDEGIELCRQMLPDLVITDYKMTPVNGMQVLERVKKIDPDIDVVMMTAYGTIEMAVEAMKKGAADYMLKGFRPEELRLKVESILQRQNIKRQYRYLREEVEVRYNFGELVGSSAAMREVFERVSKVAPTDSSVLIIGESGTGKELVARAIHMNSKRREKPFVKVNLSALAEGVLESELFGHERGAFTGALKQHRGKFELANTGTILLDEIGDMPLPLQSKLLRVLQEKEFDRVGGERPVKVDVRVIAATNRDLPAMVAEGKFREDLFYRLNIIPINLPPLRERKEDIPELVEHFLLKKSQELGRRTPTISDGAMAILMNYDFPGNVRELENLIERAVVLCDGTMITEQQFASIISADETGRIELPNEDIPLNEALEEVEIKLIDRAMRKAGGVKLKAAQILGIKPSVLYYKLDKYGFREKDTG